MMRRIRLVLVTLATLLVSGSIAAAAIPGPQRMLLPGAFGFEEIAPEIYAPRSMSEDRRVRALKDIDLSVKTITKLYGGPFVFPRVVLCPGSICDGPFGKNGARGVAYGADFVRLNEKGINEVIATHEFSHVALKERVGNWRSFMGAVPAWFDEGLATLVSADDRYEDTYPQILLDNLKTGGSWWNWGDLIKRHGWKKAYGGSRVLVRNLRRKVGQHGILEILDRVARGEAFESALAVVLTRPL